MPNETAHRRDSHRQALVDGSRLLVERGLNQGTAGNLSLRDGDAMLITPSGVPPEDIEPAMIAVMPLDGNGTWSGPKVPSSEWRLHRDILRHREDVHAVVHTHSLYATVLAIQRRSIPAIHYMIAAFGGSSIRCTPYAPFGTQALSDLIVDHLGPRHGVLLGNHGMVTTGHTMDQALWRASELETLAKMFFLASQDPGPVILDDAEIERTTERFASYGMTAEPDR